MPAHLETSNGDNVPFYERFGFEVVAVRDAPEAGPRTWLMRYEPRSREVEPTRAEADRTRAPEEAGQLGGGPAPVAISVLPNTPIEEPHAVVVAGPDTAEILARAALRRAHAPSRQSVILAVLTGVSGVAVSIIWDYRAILIALILMLWFAVPTIQLRGQKRQVREHYALAAKEGTVLAARFRPDSIEFRDGVGRYRLPYRGMLKPTVVTGAVVLGTPTGSSYSFRAYPPELFPGNTLDTVHAASLGTLPEFRSLPTVLPEP